MIQTRREEGRLIAHIISLAIKEHIKSFPESLLTSTGFDESWHIVRDTERIFSRKSFVEECAPPREIPRSHLCDRGIRYQRMIHLRFAPRHRVEPSSLCILWHDISLHIIPLIIRTPEIPPTLRLLQISVIDIHTS